MISHSMEVKRLDQMKKDRLAKEEGKTLLIG